MKQLKVKISPKEKTNTAWHHLYVESKNLKKKIKLTETESEKVVARAWGLGNRERLLNGHKLPAVRRMRSEKLMQNMVTIVNVGVPNRFSPVQFFVAL